MRDVGRVPCRTLSSPTERTRELDRLDVRPDLGLGHREQRLGDAGQRGHFLACHLEEGLVVLALGIDDVVRRIDGQRACRLSAIIATVARSPSTVAGSRRGRPATIRPASRIVNVERSAPGTISSTTPRCRVDETSTRSAERTCASVIWRARCEEPSTPSRSAIARVRAPMGRRRVRRAPALSPARERRPAPEDTSPTTTRAARPRAPSDSRCRHTVSTVNTASANCIPLLEAERHRWMRPVTRISCTQSREVYEGAPCVYCGSRTVPSSTSGGAANARSPSSASTCPLLSARRWPEGGRPSRSRLVPASASRASRRSAPSALFLYDPRPIWRALGEPWDVLDIHEEPFALATAEILLLRALAPRAPHAGGAVHRAEPAQAIPGAVPLARAVGPRRRIRHLGLQRRSGTHRRAKGFAGRARVIPLGIDVQRFSPADVPGPARPAARDCRRPRLDRRRVPRPSRAREGPAGPARRRARDRGCGSASAGRGRSRPSSRTRGRSAASPTASSSSDRSIPTAWSSSIAASTCSRCHRCRRPAGSSSSVVSPSRRWPAACRSSSSDSGALPDVVGGAGHRRSRRRRRRPREGARRRPVAPGAPSSARAGTSAPWSAVECGRRRLPRPLRLGRCTSRPATRADARGRRRRLRRPGDAAAGARARDGTAGHGRRQLVAARDRGPVRRARACATSTPAATAASRRASTSRSRPAATRRRRAAAEPRRGRHGRRHRRTAARAARRPAAGRASARPRSTRRARRPGWNGRSRRRRATWLEAVGLGRLRRRPPVS